MSANAYKRLNVSDNFVVPYTANKTWDILSSSFAENSITVNIGTNATSSLFNPTDEYNTNGQYDRLVYNSINLIYYPEFLPYTVSTQSLSNTIYNDGNLSTTSSIGRHVNLGNPNTIKFYPTGANNVIYAINVPKKLTGDKILPTTFEVYFTSGSGENQKTYKIYDDGNYNLLYSGSNISSSINTLLSQSSYVGNVFYEQNIAILTIIPDSIRLRGWRGLNPVCAQTSPSPTPSLTPSITVTPSLTATPSLTPSVTKTPSITPSVTPSITVSPSKTPSVTPSVTPSKSIKVSPSATPSLTPSNSNPLKQPTFQVLNLANDEGIIGSNSVITNITLYPPGDKFYIYDTGLYSYPLDYLKRLYGAITTANIGPSYSKYRIKVDINGFNPSNIPDVQGTLQLYLNNSIVSTKTFSYNDLSLGNGSIYFDSIAFNNTGDQIKIEFTIQTFF
jgi:hypothetical protein